MLYDPFLRKEFFEDMPWYDDFLMFHNIGVCQPRDEYVAEIREALARFLFATRTFPGKEPGTTFIAGDGFIEIGAENMAAYIQAIRGDSAGNRPQTEQPPRKDAPETTE